MMSSATYRGRTLGPAPAPPGPAPPPPPSSSGGDHRSKTLQQNNRYSSYSPSSYNNSNNNNLLLHSDHLSIHHNHHNHHHHHLNPLNSSSSIRSRSISNISRVSHSNHSTDSAATASSSGSSSSASSHCSANTDNDSLRTTPQSLSPTSRLLDEYETSKIEMFYRSHRTFVYVGQCLVSLLFTETELVDGGRQSRPKSQDWKPVCQGVPVLLFNRGDTRSRDKRQIRICVAEHGTGFQLWSDVIDNLSNYQPLKPTFHTMYLSTDHRKMAGLNFENQFAALEFYRQIELMVANPLNISLTGPNKKKHSNSSEKFKLFRRQRSKSVGRSSDIPRESPFFDSVDSVYTDRRSKHGKNKPPTKSDISAPCLFQHVTSVNLNNFDQFDSTAAEPEYPPPPPTLSHQAQPDYSTPFQHQTGHHHRRASRTTSTSA